MGTQGWQMIPTELTVLLCLCQCNANETKANAQKRLSYHLTNLQAMGSNEEGSKIIQ